MTEAQQMWDSAIAAAKALFEHPAVKAHYAALAKENAERYRREQAEAKARRDAEDAERMRSRSYDAYVLNGGADECTRFGINDGCKPHCPVFMRGECCIQEENEELFAAST